MAEVMKYPHGPTPWSIAAVDGSLVKTNKSKLLELLESGTDPVPAAAWAVDGMAVLQALKGQKSTFADMARMILQVIMSRERTSGGRVDVVFDCYRDIPIH